MKNKIQLSLVSLLCVVLNVNAQTSVLKKANKFYGVQAYAQAIPYYEKAYRKDSSNKLILSNLGDCYRLTNNVNGQIKCYGNLVKAGKAEPLHKLYYGQALMERGNKTEAKTFFLINIQEMREDMNLLFLLKDKISIVKILALTLSKKPHLIQQKVISQQ